MNQLVLLETVRDVVTKLEDAGPSQVYAIVKPLRDLGIVAGVHVGTKPAPGSIQALEWYAGQILDVVDKNAWFAMNSMLGCVDKFAALSVNHPAAVHTFTVSQHHLDELQRATEQGGSTDAGLDKGTGMLDLAIFEIEYALHELRKRAPGAKDIIQAIERAEKELKRPAPQPAEKTLEAYSKRELLDELERRLVP